jgi:nucleoside-diphosphate-sugar epimerase
LPIYSDGSNVRDWLYVEDHADALLLVVEKGKLGRSYNIGGENVRIRLKAALCEDINYFNTPDFRHALRAGNPGGVRTKGRLIRISDSNSPDSGPPYAHKSG